MPPQFDPYHRWLGIPPKHQPANHYRLLGLDMFEDDAEVICDAAERQIAHVRRYALGQHAELSQTILNELAGAKACLSDAERKSAYDAALGNSAAFLQEPDHTPADARVAGSHGARDSRRFAALEYVNACQNASSVRPARWHPR